MSRIKRSWKQTIKIDFREMPDYTRSERYFERRYNRRHYEADPRDWDAEEICEMNDLYSSGDPWGGDASIWELDT